MLATDSGSLNLTDRRFMKPISYRSPKGNLLVQEIEEVNLNRKCTINYYVPNNIALLLSVSEKALFEAKKIYSTHLINQGPVQRSEVKDPLIESRSIVVCDYLEKIQTSIVFGYTALEAFANLSIPDSHIYQANMNSKGISEVFDKLAIERYTSLKIKMKDILPKVYKAGDVTSQIWWGHFANLEQYRNDIIHQKTISHTDFYKVYFKESIFKICACPNDVIRFFHDSHAEDDKTNPIWPWLEGVETVPCRDLASSKLYMEKV